VLTLLQYVFDHNAATIQAADENGQLPIHRASGKLLYDHDIVRFLVEVPDGTATLQVCDKKGRLPVHLACTLTTSWTLDLVRFLVERGGTATLAVRDNMGWLPLHHAVMVKPVEFLVKEYAAAIGVADNDGCLPIHLHLRWAAGERSLFRYGDRLCYAYTVE